VIFSRRPAAPHTSRLRPVPGDLLQPSDLDRALSGVTTVFHLAARTVAGESFRDPAAHFRTNAQGTFELLAACRRQGVGQVVLASTGHVYGAPRALPVTEDHPTSPRSPYAASKLAAEAALQAYAQAYGMAVEVARISNLYGLGNPDTVVDGAVAQGARGEDIVVRSLDPVRDFLHASDAVEGLVRLAAAGGEPGCRIVNLSTGRGTSVREMLRLLVEALRASGRPEPAVRATGGDAGDGIPELVLANDRLRQRTGWVPETTLEEGLRTACAETAVDLLRSAP
jgi:nucleoside-diphosphate-sugar epimerase